MRLIQLLLAHSVKVLLCVLILSLTACSQSPVVLVKQAAGELVMIDRVQIKRQRQFILPSTANVALLVKPLSPKAASIDYDNTLRTIVIDEGLYTFNHVFSNVTLLESTEQGRPPSSVEFVVRASLLDAVTHVTKGAPDKEASAEEKNKPSKELLSRARPYHALLKLELIDARTYRPIDVAIIKSRSGSLGSLKFKGIVRQSFAAYSKSLTSPYAVTY